jgi:hypothetical protein
MLWRWTLSDADLADAPSARSLQNCAAACGRSRGAQLLLLIPDLDRGVISNMTEILVRRQHRQIMTNAQLSEEGIDCPDLHAISAAVIPQLSRPYVIVAIWHE